jgi:hypothetical protein
VETHADFPLYELHFADIFTAETYCYGEVLFRRRFVTGDVLLRRRFVWRRFVEEKFCMCADTFLLKDLVPVTVHSSAFA